MHAKKGSAPRRPLPKKNSSNPASQANEVLRRKCARRSRDILLRFLFGDAVTVEELNEMSAAHLANPSLLEEAREIVDLDLQLRSFAKQRASAIGR